MLKFLNLSNKINELKRIDGIFSKNLLNDLIIDKFKKVIQLQDIIKIDNLNYKSNRKQTYNFGKYSLPTFLRDIQEGYLSWKDADNGQSKFANE